MGLKGRYFSERDIRFINSINSELFDDVIQTEVTIYKISADITQINIYGESKASSGKVYYPGVEIVAIIDRAEIATGVDDFGPDRNQNVVFKFREQNLKNANLYPQTGDLVLFNERYHEINNVVQEQFLGGVPEKSLSIIVNTHYTKLSAIDLVIRQT